YEISPVATIMEKELIRELAQNIGHENGDGIMCTGGSNANMLAIHCARAKMFPSTKRSGNPNQDLCVFVSSAAHYSFKKGISLLGIGLDNLIGVNTDEQGRMDPVDLEIKINEAIKSKKTPMMIASTAGTTVMGAFDPVEKNQEIAEKYNLWHHIDGAWGGAVMFSDEHKKLIKGSEKADSFTFDAHKLLATGLITSFFLVKDGETLKEANSGGGATYLFHEYENSEFDTGPYSLQCGRKVDSLKLWLVWKSLGHEGLKDLVHGQMHKRDHLVEKIKAHPRLKLLHDPQYLNVCFQVIPEEPEVDINRYNFDLRYKVMKTGKVMTNFSSWDDGTIFFRHVFANNQTTKEDLDRLIDEIISHA
ncbi:MAG: hypothetical protein KC478_15030, partial [Bacteriovoracaceae bacterium]|nr:hypothetical protein [Bacteriovoracaceae bacterium]